MSLCVCNVLVKLNLAVVFTPQENCQVAAVHSQDHQNQTEYDIKGPLIPKANAHVVEVPETDDSCEK